MPEVNGAASYSLFMNFRYSSGSSTVCHKRLEELHTIMEDKYTLKHKFLQATSSKEIEYYLRNQIRLLIRTSVQISVISIILEYYLNSD